MPPPALPPRSPLWKLLSLQMLRLLPMPPQLQLLLQRLRRLVGRRRQRWPLPLLQQLHHLLKQSLPPGRLRDGASTPHPQMPLQMQLQLQAYLLPLLLLCRCRCRCRCRCLRMSLSLSLSLHQPSSSAASRCPAADAAPAMLQQQRRRRLAAVVLLMYLAATPASALPPDLDPDPDLGERLSPPSRRLMELLLLLLQLARA